MLGFDDTGSDGEEVLSQTIVPSRRRQFLYKAKGKARARSPTPPLPSPPTPVYDSQAGAAVSSSYASDCFFTSASSPATRKRTRSSESASDDDDDDTSEPPTKRPKKNRTRPLQREGAFYEYPAPPMPAQGEDMHDNEDDAELQTVPVNLIKSFLDQVQDLDVSGWLPRGPFVACDKVAGDDELFERGSSWMPQGGARRSRGARADDEPKALDGATRRVVDSTNPCAVSRT